MPQEEEAAGRGESEVQPLIQEHPHVSHQVIMMMIMAMMMEMMMMIVMVRMRLIRFSDHVDIFKIGEKSAIGDCVAKVLMQFCN